VLLAWAALTVWALYRCAWPVLRHRESLVELALLVEQRQGISSELVAALQFDDARRRQYGLAELRGAVIADTAELSGELNYRPAGSGPAVMRSLAAATAVVLLAGAIYLLASDHVRAFANRFLLGDATFPTRTQIRLVSPGDRAAYGQPVAFRVKVGGERPKGGKVRLVGETSGEVAIVDLAPDAHDESIFAGHLRRALEDCTYVVEVGDARLGPLPLTVIPLPKVDVAMQIEAPAYAAGRFAEAAAGQPQTAALAGSRVTPIVTADKPLRSATMRINGETFSMRRDGSRFTLETENPLLARVSNTLRYEVEVEDEDGLSLERPVSGVLRVRDDRPPRITARTATRQVLPGASPAIEYSATDDFGLARVVLQRTVLRRDPSAQSSLSLRESSQAHFRGAKGDYPLQVDRGVSVSLSDLTLGIGDRVICTLQAVDYRGPSEGQAAQSEPLVFEVTDRDTLIKGLAEADAKIDRDLESIIRAESGLGGKQ
ncbi:MAG: hypothetical protein GY711_18290, partial [bacterium]|nr:hypothetical protein [bacterium]